MLAGQKVADFLGALDVGVNTQEGVDAGGDDVVADGHSLLGHPLGSAAHNRQLGDGNAGILGQLGSQDHHTGDIHAGAHVQDGRNTGQLTHTLQACAAVLLGLLRIHEAGLGGSLSGTAGHDQDDVVLQQLLHQADVGGVGTNLGVVAADHGHSAPQNTGGHALQQGLGGAELVHLGVGNAVENLDNGLQGVANPSLLLLVGDVDQLRIPVLEVLNRHFHDGLGVVTGSLGGEADELGIGNPGNGRGGDELGMEALAQGAQCGEDALHVHDDGFAGAGENHVLLAQEVTCHGNAVTHGDLVGGAADAGDGDALGAQALGVGDHLGIIGVVNDHFGQGRIVTVNDDVHVVLLHNAQVGLGVDGLGGAEQNVGELGAGHGAAPAVGQTAAQSLVNQCLRQRRAAHVGHVQSGGNFPVDGARLDAGVMPQLLGVLGSPLQEPLGAEGLAVLQQSQLGHFVSQIVDVLALGLYAPLLGNADQLFGVLNGVVAAFASLVQGMADFPAMVRMGCGTACGEAQEVTGDDAVHIAAADAPGSLLGDAAGAHGADTAAGAAFAKAAVRSLVLDTLLPGVGTDLLCRFQQRIGGGFHLLDGGSKCPILQSDFLLIVDSDNE